MFDLDIKVSSNEYFDLIRKLECLTSENEHLKHLNENQMNMIIDLRNEITDLKRQNGDLCELVGKTKKERKDYEAMQNELRSLQDENAARIEAYEQLDKRYKDLVNDCSKAMVKNVHYGLENYRLRKRLDTGCNTCPDMENTKKKNDELRELIDFKRKQIEEQANTIRDLDKKLTELRAVANESSAEIHDLKRALKSAEDDILEYRKANYALRAGAKDLQEQNQILKDSIKQLRDECSKKEEDIQYWKAKSNDYWNRRQFWKDKYDVLMTAYKTETADLKKKLKSVCETCDVPDNCVNASEAVLKDADAKIQSANDKAANAKKEAKQAKETAERYREENFVLHTQINQFKKLNDELIKELARQQNAELIMKFDRKGED